LLTENIVESEVIELGDLLQFPLVRVPGRHLFEAVDYRLYGGSRGDWSRLRPLEFHPSSKPFGLYSTICTQQVARLGGGVFDRVTQRGIQLVDEGEKRVCDYIGVEL